MQMPTSDDAAASFLILTDCDRTDAESSKAGALQALAAPPATAKDVAVVAVPAKEAVAGSEAGDAEPMAVDSKPEQVSEPGTMESSSKEGTLDSKGSGPEPMTKKRPSAGTVSPSPSMIAEVMGPDSEEVRQQQFAKMKSLVSELDLITASLKKNEAEETTKEPNQEQQDESGGPSVVKGHPEPAFDNADFGDGDDDAAAEVAAGQCVDVEN